MIDRIRTIMEHYKLSQQDFASLIGISAATLSSIFNGRTQPSQRAVTGIHQAFPEINVKWLMFNEGDMLGAETGSAGVVDDANAAHQGAVIAPEEADALGSLSTGSAESPSLFPEEAFVAPRSTVEQRANAYGSRRDNRSVMRGDGNVMTSVINIDKEGRRIKEIRVFYSNGTYESFVPSNK